MRAGRPARALQRLRAVPFGSERYLERGGQPLMLAMLDVDLFKQYNDHYGHQAGDEVLRQVARVLRHCTTESELVARYGGEEFVLLLPDTPLTEAQQVQLTHLFPGTRYLQSAQTLMVPAPRDANFEPLRDKPIIDWAWAFLARVFPPAPPTT